jgi:hypothetical protein
MLTERLSERLKELTASAAQLPPDVQDELAERLAVELDNARWDARLADDANLGPFREMIEEARRGPKLPWPSPKERLRLSPRNLWYAWLLPARR